MPRKKKTQQDVKPNSTANKRNPIQVMVDRTEMLRLLRRGYTQSMIAEKFGLTQPQISYDWKIVLKEIQQKRNDDVKVLMAMKLEEIGEIKKEAWEAWERSKENSRKHVEEDSSSIGDGEDGEGGKGRLKTIDTTEGRLPNSDYLRLVLACVDAERELLGIDAPKKLEVEGKTTISWSALIGEVQTTPSGEVPDIIEAEIVKALPAPISAPESNVPHVDSPSAPSSNGTPLNGDGRHSEEG